MQRWSVTATATTSRISRHSHDAWNEVNDCSVNGDQTSGVTLRILWSSESEIVYDPVPRRQNVVTRTLSALLVM